MTVARCYTTFQRDIKSLLSIKPTRRKVIYMPDHSTTKNLQRRAGISNRKALVKETAQHFSQIISEKLIVDPVFVRAKNILSYQPYAGEVDTFFFNEYSLAKGKKLAFPICYDNGIMLAAVPNTPDAWETGKYGIKAPVESQSSILIPMDIDLVIVPCTAFDGHKRMRIGWGAGYYDRFLPKCRNAVKIAIAYEVQHIPGLCCDEWDVPLDAIVTELNWF